MADGGGQGLGVTLSADLIARAIIAAARSYGDDPVDAMTSTARFGRRALTAAAGGVARAMDVTPRRPARILKINDTNIYSARTRGGAEFLAAELAAMRAVEFALRRPENGQIADDGPEAHPAPIVHFELIEPGPKTTLPGPIASRSRPAPPPPLRSASGLAQAERSIRDLILEALTQRPMNTMSLASMIDRKEMAVSSTLGQMENEGLVEYRAVNNGPRRFEWLLKVA